MSELVVEAAQGPPKRKPGRPRVTRRATYADLLDNVLVEFLTTSLTKNERGVPFTLHPIQADVIRTLFPLVRDPSKPLLDPDGTPRYWATRLPWSTIVYSTVKKSGKSAMNAALTLAWAYTQEAPNEIYLLANDEEQARGRVYAMAGKMIKHNPPLDRRVKNGLKGIQVGQFELLSDTFVRAISSDAGGAAGSNHGFVSFDELWAYSSTRMQHLWDEMTPVPTRVNSLRFVTTYAGYSDQSNVLWDLYKTTVGPEEYAQGQGQRVRADWPCFQRLVQGIPQWIIDGYEVCPLPIYANLEAGTIAYWDHEGRLPWQDAGYYAQQRAQLRPAAFARLHRNEWVTAQTTFLAPEQWRACIDEATRPILEDRGLSVVLGVDAAVKKDSAAVVAVTFDEARQRVRIVNARVWSPSAGDPIDLEATIEACVREWATRYSISAVAYDPYQLAVVSKHLTDAGLPMVEVPQTQDRLTAIGQALWEVISQRTLEAYHDERLEQHVLNLVTVETSRGFRLAKDKARNKIDLAIALAMAVWHALGAQRPVVRSWGGGLPAPGTEAEQLARDETARREAAAQAVLDGIRRDGWFGPGLGAR